MVNNIFNKMDRKFRKMLKRRNVEINEFLTRPFKLQELRPVPVNYDIGPPNFVGIATGKAGTSWWYQLLLEHPAVRPNRLRKKELDYFYHFGYNGINPKAIETYHQAFAAPVSCICGEWSPGYLTYPLAIDYLSQAAPNAKLLAIVRNPIDKLLSAMNMKLAGRAKYMGLRGDRAYIYKIFSLFPEVICNCRYYDAFRHLLNVYERTQLLLLQYEECAQDPATQIARTYRFLGLDESFIPTSLHRKVNKRPYIIPQLEAQEREILADYFSEEVFGLVELFPEINLSHWPDFKDR